MRQLFIVVSSSLLSFNAFSQGAVPENAKDSINSVTVNGKVLVANVGFAPIPAFSFDSPLGIVLLSIKKKRFSYEPDLALGLNGKPWMANNWLRLTLRETKNLKLNAGINPFLFFMNEKIASGDVIYTQRNVTFELVNNLKLSGRWSVNLTYRHNNGWNGALSGHFFDISSTIGIGFPKMISIDLRPQLFYFNFTGTNDGIFASTHISIEHKRFPLSVYFQGVLPIWTGFPGSGFKWNTGLGYDF